MRLEKLFIFNGNENVRVKRLRGTEVKISYKTPKKNQAQFSDTTDLTSLAFETDQKN